MTYVKSFIPYKKTRNLEEFTKRFWRLIRRRRWVTRRLIKTSSLKLNSVQSWSLTGGRIRPNKIKTIVKFRYKKRLHELSGTNITYKPQDLKSYRRKNKASWHTNLKNFVTHSETTVTETNRNVYSQGRSVIKSGNYINERFFDRKNKPTTQNSKALQRLRLRYRGRNNLLVGLSLNLKLRGILSAQKRTHSSNLRQSRVKGADYRRYKKLFNLKSAASTRAYTKSQNSSFAMAFTKKKLECEISSGDALPFSLSRDIAVEFSSTYKVNTYVDHVYLSQGGFGAVYQGANVVYKKQLRNLFYSNSLNYSLAKYKAPSSQEVYAPTFRDLMTTSPSTTSPLTESGKFLLSWNLESFFVKKQNLKSPTATFVLAKAPTYRMGRSLTTPISTSQFYGNLYDTLFNLPQKSSTLALFQKSLFNAASLRFSRSQAPHNPILQFKDLTGQDRTIFKNQLCLNTSKLLHVGSSVTLLDKANAQGEATFSKAEKTLLNMRQVTKSKLQNRKIKNSRHKTFKRQKFVRKLLPVMMRKVKVLAKEARRKWRRSSRFIKWKVKKHTLFFNRFSRMSRTRKSFLKALTKSNSLQGKYLKHNYLSKSTSDVESESILRGPQAQAREQGTLVSRVNQLTYPGSSLSSSQTAWLILLNPVLLKWHLLQNPSYKAFGSQIKGFSNLVPDEAFNKNLSKKVLNSFANRKFREDLIPLYQNTVVRFIEFCTGKKALFQFYPFVNQHISKDYIVRYKRWLPRMGFYERRLGHRFFLEESLHIIHISFVLRDPKIIASWLRAMILRISFWKTRSIFRFLKYLFHNYFTHVFDDVKIKGLKIRLKGKISAAGNSRKRTILYRIGKTSHSEVNLRVVKDFSLVNTFTGVMGFQVYLFY